ncbi:MAG TPA: nucleotidyltransferase family protein [Nitrospinota bacterium]|jgi:molybdopterin-guanine dinucleotide biosynthesis protein A|nr:nucleotidyltransferase family protein [Nitrospinota bacterium]
MAVYNAILLVGDRRGAKKVFGKNKALLEIREIPSFIRVLAALQNVESIGEIRIVGPSEKIHSLLKKHSKACQGSKTVKVVPQKDNVIDNVWTAFIDTLPGYRAGMEISPEQKEMAVLIVAGDIPMLVPDEINEFISNCDLSRFDYYVGVVSEKTLSHFAPGKRGKGLKLAVLPFKENKYRVNNLHLVKPFKIANRFRLQDMYELRYQQKLRNIFTMFIRLIRLKGIKDAAFFYLLILSTLFFSKIGFREVSVKISSFLTLTKVTGIVDRILGTRMSVAETTYGGAALDIDNKTDFNIINEKFEEWMECQKNK